MQGYKIQFQIYAENEQEAENARQAIVGFIKELASYGRAVTGRKIAKGLPLWKSNPFVRNRVMDFFKPEKAS